MYSAYTVKKLPKENKKSICLTFGCEFVQFNHKNSEKGENRKNEQKSRNCCVQKKKNNKLLYFRWYIVKLVRRMFAKGLEKEEIQGKTGADFRDCKGLYDKNAKDCL